MALGAQALSTTVAAYQALSSLALAQAAVNVVLGQIGADTRTLNFQDQFISQLSDATKEALAGLTEDVRIKVFATPT